VSGGFAVLAGLALATLVSEDATAIGAGLAVGEGRLPLVPAMLACGAGIYVGDLVLWAAGRVAGRRALRWRPVASCREPVDRAAAWLDRRPALAILGSRFLPGTRLPLYVAAGAAGRRPGAFAFWSLVAVSLWTPLLVGGVALLGAGLAAPLDRWLGGGWAARALLVAGVFVALRALAVQTRAHSPRRADSIRRLPVRLERARRWEFWPGWLFNIPVVLWVAVLGVRYRSLTLFTLANPAIPAGGFVGESKSAILAQLPREWVMPWAVVPPGSAAARMASLESVLREKGWSLPLVFKPDVGQRGASVRWIADLDQASHYLSAVTGAVVVQLPHEGPFEAGLFYVRRPSERLGRLFSVTDKRFPVIEGDGTSTLGALIDRHPRFRLQADVFRARMGARWNAVPGAGEPVALGRAGNHCQGTEFLDGQWLVTPALERRIDAIARRVPGFFFGRFDVRYRDRARFMAGEDLAIIELNGVTSEATHIYDPSTRLVRAWATLMRQWAIAFAIGAEHRRRGLRPTPISTLLRTIWTFARKRDVATVSD
jgi:membrane protein DedA with SNARE-associated domain